MCLHGLKSQLVLPPLSVSLHVIFFLNEGVNANFGFSQQAILKSWEPWVYKDVLPTWVSHVLDKSLTMDRISNKNIPKNSQIKIFIKYIYLLLPWPSEEKKRFWGLSGNPPSYPLHNKSVEYPEFLTGGGLLKQIHIRKTWRSYYSKFSINNFYIKSKLSLDMFCL